MADINFIRERGETNVEIINVDYHPADGSNFLTYKKPDWVNIFNDGNELLLYVALSVNVVDSLPAGRYEDRIVVYENILINPGNGGPSEVILSVIDEYSVAVVLTDHIPTEVFPNRFDFYYQIGNTSFPVSQSLTISSIRGYAITANQSWLRISEDSGTANQTVQVGVSVLGLTPGTYNGLVQVSDSYGDIEVAVELLIDGETGTEDFLFVTPDILRFEFTRFGFIPNPQNISVNASGVFSVESEAEWFGTSITTGTENTLSFDAILNPLINNLTIGVYTSQCVIRLGEISKIVSIELTISQFMEEVFDADTLYFTDDENSIRLASSDIGTNLVVRIEANYNQQLFRFTYAVPFFRGESKTYVGKETRKILGKLSPEVLENTGIIAYVPYAPARLNFQISENILYTDTIVRGMQLSDIRFIKGVRPEGVKLSSIPEKIYLTTEGVLSLSFLSASVPDVIRVTGDLDRSFVVAPPQNEFYSILFPLRSFSLETGQQCTVTVAGVSTVVQIKPKGLDQCIVFWENKWGCFDAFECTGKISIRNAYKYTKETYRHSRSALSQALLEVATTQRITIDTGWIYSGEEVVFLTTMLQSKNVYLKYKEDIIPINHLTSNLTLVESRRYKTSFKLTFENVLR